MVVAVLMLTACAAAAPSPARSSYDESTGAAAPPAAQPTVVVEEVEVRGGGEAGNKVLATTTERLVIKNGTLSLIVDDPDKSMDNITNLAEELGGFVVSADLRESTLESGAKVPYANITIGVPAESFNVAIERIKKESDQLPRSENINSQDVTGEYTDLESRLRNLEVLGSRRSTKEHSLTVTGPGQDSSRVTTPWTLRSLDCEKRGLNFMVKKRTVIYVGT